MTPADIRTVADKLDAVFDMPTHIALLRALSDLYEAANVYWQHPSNSNWDVAKQALAKLEQIK